MLFNSFEFAIFFPVVTLLFFLLPHRFRWMMLLAASCFFYMFFKPVYILILFFTILIDYFAGIWIAAEKDIRRRKLYLLMSIMANVGVLAVFKYYNFITDNVNALLGFVNSNTHLPLLDILLPIGLSFHTFQAMSYTIEVYRGNQAPERHLGIYALYVMFYPQLVAGPIERPQHIIHQFYEEKRFDYAKMRSGLVLIAWGLVKKVVIADRLALFVNPVYGSPYAHSGITLAMATVFFAFQIFCDFSGYSDIAVGTARCMGYELMTNFDRPYRATGIGEFWRRWHISLSSWFRDYVYIPLGGNRVGEVKRYRNLFIVFILSGVWHGANWTFVVWGGLHGTYLVAEDLYYKKFPERKNVGSTGVTLFRRTLVFLLVVLAWVFFRARNLEESLYILRHFFSNWTQQLPAVVRNTDMSRLRLLYLGQPADQFYLAILFIGLLVVVHRLQGERTFDHWLLSLNRKYRWPIYYMLVILFLIFGVFNRSGFIYFQF